MESGIPGQASVIDGVRIGREMARAASMSAAGLRMRARTGSCSPGDPTSDASERR